MSKKRFQIIRDTREKEGKGWYFTESEDCSGTTTIKLDTGDYSFEGGETNIVTIDRKATANELAGNIFEARFWKELERMQEYRWRFVICEFPLKHVIEYPVFSDIPSHHKGKKVNIKLNGKFFHKNINIMQTKYNINVVFCDNSDDAKKCCYNIIREIFNICNP